MNASDKASSPILTNKDFDADSAFPPESLLREARRQKPLTPNPVPKVCLLDPDDDVVRRLNASGRSKHHVGWTCYHTDLFVVEEEGLEIGIVGYAVASFAVLVAEELRR